MAGSDEVAKRNLSHACSLATKAQIGPFPLVADVHGTTPDPGDVAAAAAGCSPGAATEEVARAAEPPRGRESAASAAAGGAEGEGGTSPHTILSSSLHPEVDYNFVKRY